jgi:glucose-1-phosphate cytidylyltransferase
VETGSETNTGGRLKRIAKHVAGETFFMTYGDGVGDIDLRSSLEFHRRHGRLVTVTTTRPPSRFGSVGFDPASGRVNSFWEKPKEHADWINGGFFVMEPAALDYIEGDHTAWENEPMRRLTADGQLGAFRHDGFWQPMDTLREKKYLEQVWAGGNAPWKVW